MYRDKLHCGTPLSLQSLERSKVGGRSNDSMQSFLSRWNNHYFDKARLNAVNTHPICRWVFAENIVEGKFRTSLWTNILWNVDWPWFFFQSILLTAICSQHVRIPMMWILCLVSPPPISQWTCSCGDHSQCTDNFPLPVPVLNTSSPRGFLWNHVSLLSLPVGKT